MLNKKQESTISFKLKTKDCSSIKKTNEKGSNRKISSQNINNLLKIIDMIQSPLDKINLVQQQKRIDQLLKQALLSKEQEKSIKIKFYCKVLTACIKQNNHTQGHFYFDKLQKIMSCLLDVSKAIYFLFQVKSLQKLRDYNINQNLQYKEATNVQLVFYYILSLLNQSSEKAYHQKCEKILSAINNKQAKSKLQSFIEITIRNKESNRLVRQFIKRLVELQKHYSTKSTNKIDKMHNMMRNQIVQIIQFYKSSHNKQQFVESKKVLQCLQNSMQKNNVYIYNAILQTPFIQSIRKKCAEHRQQVEQKKILTNFDKRFEKFNGINSVKYTKCNQGIYLRKCNYDNDNVQIRYLEFTQQGVYWGQSKDSISLKYEWQDIQGVFYGKITKNALQKLEGQNGDKIFSFITAKRSVDFICDSSQQAQKWALGLNYALHSYNKDKNRQVIALRTQGQQLWKKMFQKIKSTSNHQENLKNRAEIIRKINDDNRK